MKEKNIKLAIKILSILLVLIIVFKYVIGIEYITSIDMYPSFRDGDFVATYKLGDYYTKDVVVYEINGNKKIGRIVATEGDTINVVEDGYYEINGGVPYEDIFYPTEKKEGNVEYPYTVKEGEVFIMGDMRQQATDSRVFGAIKKENISGKVILLMFRTRGF